MATNQRKLVFAILEFLQSAITDGSVKTSSVESLEVAMECIGEAFDVDASDEAQRSEYSIKPANLQQVLDLYLRTHERMAAKPSSAGEAATAEKTLTDEQKAQAEELKAQGNRALANKQFEEAVEFYTKAIAINSQNPIYYANRSAAYSQQGDYSRSVDDANEAIKVDPTYSKAYSRLGHGYFGLEQYDLAVKAYDKGLELDPNNLNMKSAREVAQQRLDESSSIASNAPSASPSTRGGDTPGGGMGGMDLNALLSNPGLMGMASQMMSNPAIRQMAQSMMGGGGDGAGSGAAGGNQNPLESLMGNPQLREMAQQFMGGSRGQGGGEGGNGNDDPLAQLAGNPDMRRMAEQFMRSQGNNSPQ
ncbi:Small glutamine-rich tetratricopeptide repeat-containing protein 2 [Dimargaris verticillata]|uniref:Small glutamine-rich tetratricopeptide repeat-containing protein 2 n=1 Tax=Dimargaris verticillata TaxID=2761393 RepID=A0A9W8BCH8_9FUNG|nr:Small glutamine-rich tetratricopeptide repeat-containing protein 2 [Dimargaris verticillata]